MAKAWLFRFYRTNPQGVVPAVAEVFAAAARVAEVPVALSNWGDRAQRNRICSEGQNPGQRSWDLRDQALRLSSI